LNAIPQGSTDQKCRRELIVEAGGEIDLPSCSAPFLLGALLEIGPAISGGMALAPIGWRDVEAWQRCTSVKLPPWQAQMLVNLSRQYVSFARDAEKPDCRAPWDEEDVETRRERVSRQLKAAMKALSVRKKG
jgi:hypothetical protein